MKELHKYDKISFEHCYKEISFCYLRNVVICRMIPTISSRIVLICLTDSLDHKVGKTFSIRAK